MLGGIPDLTYPIPKLIDEKLVMVEFFFGLILF